MYCKGARELYELVLGGLVMFADTSKIIRRGGQEALGLGAESCDIDPKKACACVLNSYRPWPRLLARLNLRNEKHRQ